MRSLRSLTYAWPYPRRCRNPWYHTDLFIITRRAKIRRSAACAWAQKRWTTADPLEHLSLLYWYHKNTFSWLQRQRGLQFLSTGGAAQIVRHYRGNNHKPIKICQNSRHLPWPIQCKLCYAFALIYFYIEGVVNYWTLIAIRLLTYDLSKADYYLTSRTSFDCTRRPF